MDFLNKTLIGEYSYSDANTDRTCMKRVYINGRKYFKTGTKTATTVVAFQYKVFNPSINRSEYVTVMGAARQHTGDTTIDKETGLEIAAEKALTSPVATFTFPSECSEETIHSLMEIYVDELPINFIKTEEELLLNGNDLTIYNRHTVKTNKYNKYFTDYYKDLKKHNPQKYSDIK